MTKLHTYNVQSCVAENQQNGNILPDFRSFLYDVHTTEVKIPFCVYYLKMVDEFPDADETMMLVVEDLLEKFGTQNDGYVLQLYSSVTAKHTNIR